MAGQLEECCLLMILYVGMSDSKERLHKLIEMFYIVPAVNGKYEVM